MHVVVLQRTYTVSATNLNKLNLTTVIIGTLKMTMTKLLAGRSFRMVDYVLIAIVHDNPGIHGYEITKRFNESGTERSHQQVYRTMGRLEDMGILKSTTQPIEGKPDRRLYECLVPLDAVHVHAKYILSEFLHEFGTKEMIADRIQWVKDELDVNPNPFIRGQLVAELDYLAALGTTSRYATSKAA